MATLNFAPAPQAVPFNGGSFKNILYVDANAPSGGNGSILQPYSTISAALAAIPTPLTAADTNKEWTVVISPADYDEDLIFSKAIRLSLVGLGPWRLGNYSTNELGLGGAISGTRVIYSSTVRNIVWTLDSGALPSGGSTPQLNILAMESSSIPVAGTPSMCRISGSISILGTARIQVQPWYGSLQIDGAGTLTLASAAGFSVGDNVQQAAATVIALGSDGVNVNTFAGAGVLNVVSTHGFASSGTLNVATGAGTQTVTYTGLTLNSFTGCSSAGAGVMSTGGVVSSSTTNNVLGQVAAVSGSTITVIQADPPGAKGSFSTLVSITDSTSATTTTVTSIGSGNGGPFPVAGTATTGGALALPQATIPVLSTANFPTSGTIKVLTTAGFQTVTYTGITSTSFTGCSGGTGSTGATPNFSTVYTTTGLNGNTGHNMGVSCNMLGFPGQVVDYHWMCRFKAMLGVQTPAANTFPAYILGTAFISRYDGLFAFSQIGQVTDCAFNADVVCGRTLNLAGTGPNRPNGIKDSYFTSTAASASGHPSIVSGPASVLALDGTSNSWFIRNSCSLVSPASIQLLEEVSVALPVSAVTSLTATQSGITVLGNPTAGSFAVNLPALTAGVTDNMSFTIKNVGTANAVNVTPSGTNTIDGVNALIALALPSAATFAAPSCLKLVANGTNWNIVAKA